MLEVKGVRVMILEGTEDLVAHPFDLGLGELDYVVGDVVKQRQREFGQPRLLTTPQLVQQLRQLENATW